MAMSNEGDRAKLVVAICGLACSLLAAAWLLGFFESDDGLSADPAVAELQQEMRKFREQEQRQPPDDAQRNQYRQRMEQLSPDQREEFFASSLQVFAPMMEKRLNGFFAQSEGEQRAQIDREIDAMEAMRRQGGGGRGGPFGGRPPGGNADPKQMQSMMKRMNAHTSPEMRAMMDARMRMMNERRDARGLGSF